MSAARRRKKARKKIAALPWHEKIALICKNQRSPVSRWLSKQNKYD